MKSIWEQEGKSDLINTYAVCIQQKSELLLLWLWRIKNIFRYIWCLTVEKVARIKAETGVFRQLNVYNKGSVKVLVLVLLDCTHPGLPDSQPGRSKPRRRTSTRPAGQGRWTRWRSCRCLSQTPPSSHSYWPPEVWWHLEGNTGGTIRFTTATTTFQIPVCHTTSCFLGSWKKRKNTWKTETRAVSGRTSGTYDFF